MEDSDSPTAPRMHAAHHNLDLAGRLGDPDWSLQQRHLVPGLVVPFHNMASEARLLTCANPACPAASPDAEIVLHTGSASASSPADLAPPTFLLLPAISLNSPGSETIQLL